MGPYDLGKIVGWHAVAPGELIAAEGKTQDVDHGVSGGSAVKTSVILCGKWLDWFEER